MKTFSNSSFIALTFALALAQSGPAMAFTFTGSPGTNGTGEFPNGGHGGNVTVSPLSGESEFWLYGGNGGNGINASDPIYGYGGDGGSVTAVDTFSISGPFSTSIYAEGGDGGSGYGAGQHAGNGGLATAGLNVASTDGSDLSLSVTQVGGDGGSGGSGASGASGSGSMLDNAVVGQTTGALRINQSATGGNGGGGGQNATGGAGGNATSILTLANISQASSLSLSSRAAGGSAGGASDVFGLVDRAGDAVSGITVEDNVANSVLISIEALAGQGGTASGGAKSNGAASAIAEGSVIVKGASGYVRGILGKPGASLSTNLIVADGGRGGTTYSGSGDAPDGGDARASFVGNAYGSVAAYLLAYGGGGGTSAFGGNGGDGGYAEATGTIVVNSPAYGDDTGSYLSVDATGGSGSYGSGYVSYGTYGAGFKSGNGGEAKISGSATILGTDPNSTLQVFARQTGGNGGTAAAGAEGGDGADSTVENAIAISTLGKLYLSQTAVGGEGGLSDTAKGGDGGSAFSRLVMQESTASSLDIISTANGGGGGKSNGQKGVGGSAESFADINSAISGAPVTVQSYAYAGGTQYPENYSPIKGTGSATAMASGLGTNNAIKSAAHAQGSSGNVYSSSSLTDSSGNKLTTTVNAPIPSSELMSASTLSVSGLSSAVGYYSGFANNNARSFGNISLTASSPVKSTTLKTTTGDFTEIADGLMGATNEYSGSEAEIYSLSASYSFTDLGVGSALLFSLTGTGLTGTGMSSANFSLAENGAILYSHAFTSQSEWDAFFANPLYLGETSGSTNLDLALSNIVLGEDSSYAMSYKFVIASAGTLSGTYTDVSVPLPAAAPLFSSALLGLGLWGRRRKRSA